MLSKKLVEELVFLLEEAEEKIWRKAEGVLLHLYWQLGYCLKDYSEEEISSLSKELSLLFDVEQKMFQTAYRFYKDNPLKKKVMRAGG